MNQTVALEVAEVAVFIEVTNDSETDVVDRFYFQNFISFTAEPGRTGDGLDVMDPVFIGQQFSCGAEDCLDIRSSDLG